MQPSDIEETRNFWDRTAEDWRVQVGDAGDRNRILNSDPVLWDFLGDVADRTVLDAGCGTGYLSRQLAARGAAVVGVDFSQRMIEVAQREVGEVEFRVDSCMDLATCADAEFDALVSNYVLMDLPDLQGAVDAFYRVLRPGGLAVVVFSHPCFPAAMAKPKRKSVDYHWPHSYFEPTKHSDPPWAHFKDNFIWFHRPLSDYWRSFVQAGFRVTGFDEPKLTADRFHLATDQERETLLRRPYSVAFQLEKPA